MTTLIIIGAVLVLIIVGLLALCRTPAASTTGGVTLDIQGQRMTVPDWAWNQILSMLTSAELQAYTTAIEAEHSSDYSYEDVIAIGRVQTVAWEWMTTTRQGRQWLSRTHPNLLHDA